MTPAEMYDKVSNLLWNRQHPKSPFWEANWKETNPSSTPATVQTVVVQRHQMESFRAHYAELAAFAAVICNVPVETLCNADMTLALIRQKKGHALLAAAKGVATKVYGETEGAVLVNAEAVDTLRDILLDLKVL